MKIGKNVIYITLMLFGLLFVSSCVDEKTSKPGDDKTMEPDNTPPPIVPVVPAVPATPLELESGDRNRVPRTFSVRAPAFMISSNSLNLAGLADYIDPKKKGNVVLLQESIKTLDDSVNTENSFIDSNLIRKAKLAMIFASAARSFVDGSNAPMEDDANGDPMLVSPPSKTFYIEKGSKKITLKNLVIGMGFLTESQADEDDDATLIGATRILKGFLDSEGIKYDTHVMVPATCYVRTGDFTDNNALIHNVRISSKATVDADFCSSTTGAAAVVVDSADELTTTTIGWSDNRNKVQITLPIDNQVFKIRYNATNSDHKGYSIETTLAAPFSLDLKLNMVDCKTDNSAPYTDDATGFEAEREFPGCVIFDYSVTKRNADNTANDPTIVIRGKVDNKGGVLQTSIDKIDSGASFGLIATQNFNLVQDVMSKDSINRTNAATFGKVAGRRKKELDFADTTLQTAGDFEGKSWTKIQPSCASDCNGDNTANFAGAFIPASSSSDYFFDSNADKDLTDGTEGPDPTDMTLQKITYRLYFNLYVKDSRAVPIVVSLEDGNKYTTAGKDFVFTTSTQTHKDTFLGSDWEYGVEGDDRKGFDFGTAFGSSKGFSDTHSTKAFMPAPAPTPDPPAPGGGVAPSI